MSFLLASLCTLAFLDVRVLMGIGQVIETHSNAGKKSLQINYITSV